MSTRKTSIIILTYNKLEYTQMCIESIRKYTSPKSYEIIVVDNNSTDGTREWLAEQTSILTIFNEENSGFPKGCNQGIEIASGASILLLNNDVLVTENWLDLLNDCLFSSEDIGAVGPISNSAYGDQEIEVSYSDFDEMWNFANQYNRTSEPLWKQRLKLIGFCMLIKREALEKVGLLDELFSPGLCEDSDYSFRLTNKGYKLMLCKNVFIHHFGSTSFNEMAEKYKQLWERNRQKFQDKWGFHTAHHTQPREDIIKLFDPNDRQRNINVLDIGCACGATLLEIKNQYPLSNLYGIEKNESAAQIASNFAEVLVGNVEEQWNYQDNYFDYIILGDVLQQVIDPQSVLVKIKSSLKNNGTIIVSIPNASHYANIYNLLKDEWSLQGNSSVGQNNLHLFTKRNITELLDPHFENIRVHSTQTVLGVNEEAFVKRLDNVLNLNLSESYKIQTYIIVANKQDLLEYNNILLGLYNDSDNEDLILKLVELMHQKTINTDDIIMKVDKYEDIDKQDFYNTLTRIFYKHQLLEDIIPLLNASLAIDNKHTDTLFNFAAFLNNMEAYTEAMFFIDLIEEQDEEVLELKKVIQNNLNNGML